ncbi:hypothetical protein S83_064035 [Arachis hypogaea]
MVIYRCCSIIRSVEDTNVFLVNDSQHTLQMALSSLELPRAISVACGPSVDETNLNENQERIDSGANNLSASVPQFHGRPKHKAHDPRDLSIQVLEKFSLVTRFARETTSQLFGENQNNGFSGYERSTQIQPNLDQPKKSTDIAENVPAENPVIPDPKAVTYSLHC